MKSNREEPETSFSMTAAESKSRVLRGITAEHTEVAEEIVASNLCVLCCALFPVQDSAIFNAERCSAVSRVVENEVVHQNPG